VTYAIPFKNFPVLDWIRTDLSVDANYSWHAASINTDSLGNVIQNGQQRQVSADFDFIKLYGKVPLLAKINKTGGSKSSSKGGQTKSTPDPSKKDEPKKNKQDDKKSTDKKEPSADQNKTDNQKHGKLTKEEKKAKKAEKKKKKQEEKAKKKKKASC
jgi:cell surface protein SprA